MIKLGHVMYTGFMSVEQEIATAVAVESPTSSLFSASTQFITTLQRVYYLSVFTSVSASISNSNQKVSLQPAHFRVGTAETLII